MLKDFFYFPKSQRYAIVILLILIFLVFAADFVLQMIPTPETRQENDTFLAQTDEFMKNLKSADSIRKQKQYEDYNFAYRKSGNKKSEYTLFPFNPNTTDSITFVKLGIKSYVIKNILKYRSKGGNYKSVDDFAKVWGITEEKFNELKPFIVIPSKTEITKAEKSETVNPIFMQTEILPEILVDINTADTTQLMTIKGIGRKYARGIVKYRTLLGGYQSVEQVREVYGMTSENFEKIKDKLTITTISVSKIDINKASVDRLRSHPYLNFYQAKAVYELRRNKGKLKSIAELNHLEEFTPEQLKKVQPYFNFD